MGDAEEKLKSLAENLAKQGVNVDDFKLQQKMTEEKIAELDRVIQEDLPKMEQELINQYKEEKEEHLRKSSSLNFVEERAEENKSFFKLAPTEEEKVAERKNTQQKEIVKIEGRKR